MHVAVGIDLGHVLKLLRLEQDRYLVRVIGLGLGSGSGFGFKQHGDQRVGTRRAGRRRRLQPGGGVDLPQLPPELLQLGECRLEE